MTNPTPHGQVPEALYAAAMEFAAEKASIAYVQRKCRCSYNDAERMLERMVNEGFIETYNGRKSATTAQPAEGAANVQNPAEIEHVAGDVSKNGAGLDMTQQPVAQQGAASEPTPPKGEELRALSDRYWGREDLRDAHAAGVACGFALGVRALRTQQPCPTAPAAPALTQGAAIAAGAVYAELPDDVIDYVKGSYAFLQSTAPDGYAEEVFSLPPSATRNQRSLQDALQSDKRGWHPAAARQDSGDGKRSGPDAGVSASHGQAPATQQAVSSAVLKAIREANMQLVRTGDNAFMLVPYKVATAQADSQPAPGNEAILSAARNWGDVQQYNRTDGKGTEHRIVFSMPKRAAHFARELLAARKQGGA